MNILKEKTMLTNPGKLAVMLILCFPLFLWSQETAEIVFAEGEGFTLVRNGDNTFHDLYEEPVEGMALLPGDLILTEQGTWLEIEINRTGSLIKIAENTTFTINSLENRGGTFQVSYGRIRAKVEKLTDDSPFWVQGVDTVAGVRGTDFGYDLFFDRESPEKARTDVYCFQGKVEVVKVPLSGESLDGTVQEPQSVIIGRNEMVTVFSDSDEPLEKERVSPDLKEFWGVNEFEYEPVGEKAEINPESVTLTSFHNDSRQLRQAALFSSISGALIAGTGLAGYYLADSPPAFAIGMGGLGGFLLGGAGYFTIRAMILENRNESYVSEE